MTVRQSGYAKRMMTKDRETNRIVPSLQTITWTGAQKNVHTRKEIGKTTRHAKDRRVVRRLIRTNSFYSFEDTREISPEYYLPTKPPIVALAG